MGAFFVDVFMSTSAPEAQQWAVETRFEEELNGPWDSTDQIGFMIRYRHRCADEEEATDLARRLKAGMEAVIIRVTPEAREQFIPT